VIVESFIEFEAEVEERYELIGLRDTFSRARINTLCGESSGFEHCPAPGMRQQALEEILAAELVAHGGSPPAESGRI
jgi:hypothetical protein